jgi:CheY-like chemotaxis protein
MQESMQAPENKDIRILVVEDDQFSMNICIRILSELGYTNIETDDNGKSALDKAIHAENPFDLIILDINLPEMNGLEFMRQLNEYSYRGSLILVSGEDEKLLESAYDLAESYGLQILDAIPKPINVQYFTNLLLKVESR